MILKIMEKHMTGLSSWYEPSGGMFLWVKLNGVRDSKKLIENEARDANVLLVPGQYFHPDDRISSYVRISYSVESEERCEEAIKRLANLLKNGKF